VILLTLLVATAVAIIQLRDLFAAVMLSGIFSLLSASLFVVMDAVDVAFTEAAVGAGIATVLMLGTLTQTPTRERPAPRVDWSALVVVVLTGTALVIGTLDMPGYGDPDAPIHQHVAPEYIEQSVGKRSGRSETGDDFQGHVPNMVTAILASYRGYDTLGELAVIFTAGVGVMLLLAGLPPTASDTPETDPAESEAGGDA
jgi:multicomponent Na+:H+ antiporter subunit B